MEKVPAQRGSINRPRGTLETKSVIVTREVYLDMLINELIPAILVKFPAEDLEHPIYFKKIKQYSTEHLEGFLISKSTSENTLLRPCLAMQRVFMCNIYL